MKPKLARVLPATLLALPATWALAQSTAPATPAQTPPPAASPVRSAAERAVAAAKAAGAAVQGKPQESKPGVAKPGQTPPTAGAKTATASTKGAQKTGGKKAGGPKPPAPPKPAWQQFPLNPNTTMFLDFTESNPDAVFSLFSRTSGITIIKSPQFKSPLTVTSAKAVKLDEAFTILNTVLGLQNYELRKSGNLMLVAQKQPPQQPSFQAPPPPPQPVVKTYVIQNAKASDVAKVIVDVYGPAAGGAPGGQPQGGGEMMFVNGRMVPMGGGAPGGGGANPNFKITSDDYSNSVIAKALPDEQTKIEALIKDLDRSTSQPLVARVFPLKYVPAEQAVTAIEDLLTANTPLGRSATKQTQNNNDYGGYYGYYGRQSSQRTAGGQSATAIRQTNSVNVNATKENMELVEALLKNLDQPFEFADNTQVVKLQNAKASDVADLLNKVFSSQNQNNNPFGFYSVSFDSFGGDTSRNNRTQMTDYDDEGKIVNTRDIAGKVKIEADLNTNSIVVVTQPSNMRMIRKVIEQLDALVDQVVIETVIVEANLDKTTKLGVEYNFVGDLFGGNGAGAQDFGLLSGSATNPLSGLRYTLSGSDYRVFLNAVQTDSRFKVLDTPRIFTSNNVEAEINVSQKVPYPAGQAVTTLGPVTTNVDFLDVGVVLKVTPRVTANGQVTMKVEQSADDLQSFQNFGNLSAPLTNKRKATTTVSVKDGETVVLGGIIRHTERRDDQKVPILGDLPLLGQLFRSTNRVQGQSELMVFLTPHVIRNNGDAQTERRKSTDELTKPSQEGLKRSIPPVKEP